MKQGVRVITVLLWVPLLAEQTQTVKDRLLRGGDITLHQEMQIVAQDHDWDVDAKRTTIHLAPDFQGRAAIVIHGASNVHISGLTIDGNRDQIAHALQDTAPANVAYAGFTKGNGILIEQSHGIRIDNLNAKNIAGFSILVNASDHVQISGAHLSDSGSRNAHKRNNATGGILLEEGTHDFEVTGCDLRNVLGNGIWTRSIGTSARNVDGRITANKVGAVSRNGIEIGSGSRVLVEKNTGAEIGYPIDAVDLESNLPPMAIATSGNTDAAQYRENTFEEVNGTCVGLDGFHDGEVRGNSCTNNFDRNAYPDSHFGIVINNSSPQMESRNILIWGNRLDGFLYGAALVIGSGHTISHNHFLHLNMARCNTEGGMSKCNYAEGEPDLLRSGIYLRGKAARRVVTRGNVIEDNEISGFGMGARCVVAGPDVDAVQDRIGHNDCNDDAPTSAALQPFSITRAIAFTNFRTGGSSNTGNTSSSPSHQLE